MITTIMPGVDILGVRVSPWDAAALTEALLAAVRGPDGPFRTPPVTIHYANVHVLNTAYTDAGLREQLNGASTVYCDGSGVRLGAALLGHRLPARLTAADWIDLFSNRAAEERARVFLLGGADGIAAGAADVLRARHGGLNIVGAHHGFLDSGVSDRVINQMNATGTDVALVGMGTPTQERWIGRYRPRISAPVVWSVGALFDFVVGAQRRAPSWIACRGLEWLWRWGTDPGRLTKRYIVGNPLFIVRILRQRRSGLRERP
jgi:N-acetylglucosaminyldiphosphoundecaprenol N-acetyl-beta-D-mannosaminyltransferase